MMIRESAMAILAIGICGLAWGQEAALPQLEVASIKPAPPQAPGRTSTWLKTDTGRVTYTNASISDVIGQAYKVQHNQISGPAWLDSERFDIEAKIPEDALPGQLPQMFQALLADRFHLKMHREKKELPIYNLVVAKSGSKLQKAEASTGLGGGTGHGYAHVSGTVTMSRFADYLSVRLDRPVHDLTELEGSYTVAMDWVPDSPESAGTGPSIFTALQEQLGLRLAATKGPVEVLVIDHVEKAPTAN